jgi:putative ABC transport system ATP-binding protein
LNKKNNNNNNNNNEKNNENENNIVLSTKNLSKTFKLGGKIVEAVKDITVSFNSSSLISIVGKSGSGKSTLLNLLGSLERADSGEINFEGKNIVKLSDKKLIDYRRRNVGFVFQFFNLIPNLTAVENVMLPMEFVKLNKEERIKKAKELLNQVDIEPDRFYHTPLKLSGGQQQRVAIARALANDPKIILADEPTGNIDSETGKLLVKLLHSLSKEGKTVIIVTHDASITSLSDKTLYIHDGKIVEKNNYLGKEKVIL